MKKRMPIILNGDRVGATIRIVGEPPKEKPYLSINTNIGAAYVEDRDVRRLKKWCDLCLKK